MTYLFPADSCNNASDKPQTSKLARQYLEEITPLANSIQTYRFQLYYYLIARTERETAHDYRGTAEICRRAIKFFEGKSSAPRIAVAMFSYALLVSLTMVGEFEEAEEVAIKTFTVVEEGSLNWFKTYEQHIVLKFYKRDYAGAYSIFKKATGHKSFSLLAGIEQETWKIYEGYIQLLIEAGKIQPLKTEKNSAYRVTRFLNEVPEFSKDKRGMNVSVLIIHILFLLYLHRYDEACDRMLNLEKYASRHLQESDDTFRIWCFFQALLQIKKTDFHREKAEAGAAKWLLQMHAAPAMLSDQPHEVEAVPYEHLWEMAMEALERGGVEPGDEDLTPSPTKLAY